MNCKVQKEIEKHLPKRERGFTMLELLIVIAVIGLLASIMVVGFSNAQKRARIAQGWQFSDSLRGALQMNMVGWWAFDETTGSVAKDSWFTQNHGIVHGAQWVEGIVNNALSFDGVNDYVEVADDDIFHISDAITVEVWFKAATVPQSSWANIVNRRVVSDASPYNAWIICIGPKGDTIEFFITNPAGEGPIYGQWRVLGGALTADWTHVAGTYEGTIQKIYINGQLVDSSNVSITLNTSDGPIIFASTNTLHQYFSGLIDEVRLYAAALPSAVIQQHYAQGLKRHQNLVKK